MVIILLPALNTRREPDAARTGAALIKQDEEPGIVGDVVAAGTGRTIDIPDVGNDAVPPASMNAANDRETADPVLHPWLKRHPQLLTPPSIILRNKVKLLYQRNFRGNASIEEGSRQAHYLFGMVDGGGRRDTRTHKRNATLKGGDAFAF